MQGWRNRYNDFEIFTWCEETPYCISVCVSLFMSVCLFICISGRDGLHVSPFLFGFISMGLSECLSVSKNYVCVGLRIPVSKPAPCVPVCTRVPCQYRRLL